MLIINAIELSRVFLRRSSRTTAPAGSLGLSNMSKEDIPEVCLLMVQWTVLNWHSQEVRNQDVVKTTLCRWRDTTVSTIMELGPCLVKAPCSKLPGYGVRDHHGDCGHVHLENLENSWDLERGLHDPDGFVTGMWVISALPHWQGRRGTCGGKRSPYRERRGWGWWEIEEEENMVAEEYDHSALPCCISSSGSSEEFTTVHSTTTTRRGNCVDA